MPTKEQIQERQLIGRQLKEQRIKKGIIPYRIMKMTGLQPNVTKSIEEGSANYSIDSYLAYKKAVGVE